MPAERHPAGLHRRLLGEENTAPTALCRSRCVPSDSATKYDSGSGWPSFWQPADPAAVATETDTSHGMRRVEVHCARCGSHWATCSQTGRAWTGERYCIHSLSLTLEPRSEQLPARGGG